MNIKRSRTGRFFVNALIMTATGLLMRGVVVLFNIYISRRAGAEAMGLYSLVMSAYGFALTFATSGINLGVTRLVSDTLGKLDIGGIDKTYASLEIKKIMKNALLYCFFFGSLASSLLFFGSGYIGTEFLGDERVVIPLKILALSLLPISLVSCLTGYFSALRRVYKNAICQIAGQTVLILGTSFFLSRLLPRGVEYACIALTLGSMIADLISLCLSLSFYLFEKRTVRKGDGNTTSKAQALPSGITGKLLFITLPVSFSAYIRSALIAIEHVLIPKGLKRSGSSWRSALSSYGVVHGMVLPVVLFPQVFIASFASLLVPEITESHIQNNTDRTRRVAFRVFSIVLCFSVGVSGIMTCFSYELGELLYKSREAGFYIRVLAPLIPIMYIDGTTDAILKGMGQQIYSMNVNIADAALSVVLVFFLVPKMGLYGYIISIYATETLNTVLSVSRMFVITKMIPKLWKQVFGPILSVIGATTLSKLILSFFGSGVVTIPHTFLHILLSALLYLAFIFLFKVTGRDEWEMLCAIIGKNADGKRKRKNENTAVFEK